MKISTIISGSTRVKHVPFIVIILLVIMINHISNNSHGGKVLAQCSGISSSSPNVCASHGLCVSSKCKCFDFSQQNTLISDTSGIIMKNYIGQGESLVSSNSRFQLTLNASGVVLVTDMVTMNVISTTSALSSGFVGPFQLRLSSTGSLQIYGNNVLALSLTLNPIGSAPYRFLMQNNGDAILYGKGESIYYRTSTRLSTTEAILWPGSNCDNYKCYGISWTNSSVCGGVGQCQSPNLCNCPQGTFGGTCERNCYGLHYSDTNVCSGKGSCIANDTCSCSNGYSGSMCTEFKCNGIFYNEASNPQLCSGRGSCVAPNLCNCNSGYYGNNCESYSCQGILFNSSSVCSGKGACTLPEHCDCIEGYSGNDCSQYSCFGILHNSTEILPCSGNGSCISPDNCSCSEGHFGELCDMFSCGSIQKNESNVCSGNGTCIGPNHCSCNSGYFGNSCEQYRCGEYLFDQSGVCSGNGTCISPETCACLNGFYGENCQHFDCFSIPFDQSENFPCNGSGTCVSPNTCACYAGYSGKQCTEFSCFDIPKNESEIVCSGNGTCLSPNYCSCNAGYEGAQCETFYCFGNLSSYSQVCYGNGYCVSPDNCFCKEGYSGPLCSDHYCFGIASNATDVLPCNGHGVCISPDMCSCSSGYIGDQCETFKCFGILQNETACSGNGTCLGPNNCSCHEGYEGSQCEIYKCFDKLPNQNGACSGQGVCNGPNQCLCNAGYSGPLCDMYDCFDTLFNSTEPYPCSGQGTCQGPDNCQCLEGFLGEDCQTFKCFGTFKNETSSACSGNGTCVAPDQCSCLIGHEGANCELYKCFGILFNESNVCSGDGLCVGPNECLCSLKYYGSHCGNFSCFGISSTNSSNVCSGHGSCIDADKCACDEGFIGDECSRFKCFGIFENETDLACSGNGTCVGPDQCSCKIGYEGIGCENYGCFGVPRNNSASCSRNGACVSPDLCMCVEGYSGYNCSEFSCFGYFNSSTTDMPCSGNGSCVSPDTCFCNNGYFGNECQNFNCFGSLYLDLENSCSGNGKCISPDQCLCSDGYFGYNCEDFKCGNHLFNNSEACSGNGNCVAPETCNCTLGYFGESCNSFSCFGKLFNSTLDLPCYGKGVCSLPDTCSCDTNYFGGECEQFKCFGILQNETALVCSGNGACISPDQCFCSGNYEGTECDLYRCFNRLFNDSLVCSGNGDCTAPNQCICHEGHNGPLCNSFFCFGVASNSTSILPCSGHGACEAYDQCLCNPGYIGDKCDSFDCFGKSFNSSNVCSGRGQCASPSQCVCNQNYTGTNCEEFTCFAILRNDSKACSGVGQCVDFNTCICNSDWFGNDCSVTSCFDTISNDSTVCNGRGTCAKKDVCSCKEGYFGEQCEVMKCFSYLSNETNLVCGGHGSCIGLNNCSCLEGFVSSDCSVSIQPFMISLPKVSDKVYQTNDPYTIEIRTELSGLNVTWYCLDCVVKTSSSQLQVGLVSSSNVLSIVTSELVEGTYSFIVSATIQNISPYPPRLSNSLEFNLTVIDFNTPKIQTIGLPNVFLSKSAQELSAIVSSVFLNQSIIDSFLNCTNCTVTVTYSWSIETLDGVKASEVGVTNAISSGNNVITLSPPIQLSSELYSVHSSITFSFYLTNLLATIGTSVNIPVVSAAIPPLENGEALGTNTSSSNLMRVVPNSGIALSDIFTITIIEWSADSRLMPLKYAVGFLDNSQKPIRVTEYTRNTVISIYLPYIKSLKSATSRYLEEISFEPISLVVFVQDSEGNVDWQQSAMVYLAPFNGTSSELIARINSLHDSSSVVAMFDQSYLVLGSNDLTLQLIKNITIDPKNPSAALASLNSLTSDVSKMSAEMVTEVNKKLTEFISSIDTIYMEEKQEYGFVKSKLKTADVSSTVLVSSNLLSTGLEAEGTKTVVGNVVSTVLKGEIPRILRSDQISLDSVSVTTPLIDIAISSFKLMSANQLNQTLISGNNSVVLNISSILGTYDGFSKDCGLTLITYDKNTNYDNSTSKVASNVNDFKFIRESSILPLENLDNPISLTFALVESIEKILQNLKLESSTKLGNDSTLQLVEYFELFSCKYWDEKKNMWSDRGCSLKSVDISSRTIECYCTHTTMFTTFVEQNSTFAKNVKDQVSALYGVQIGFGVVYTIIATIILVGLFILRKEQPVSSRLFTPYFGMVALIMESVLIYIIQRSILANQLLNSSPEVWEQGDSVANIIANVVAIVVNTLNLTAILCYVIQVSRFQLMKYLHQLLASSRGNEEKSEKTLMILRYVTSPSLSFSILTTFGFVNVIYWLFWVMLRRLNAIEPATYTYIVSISYTVCILTFSVLISCVVVLDFIGSTYKEFKNGNKKRTNLEDLVHTPNTSFVRQKKKLSDINVRQLITDFIVSMDGPLYFRMEMLLYIVCFTFLVLNQGIGLSSLPFRYESVESFKKALLLDGISFIFEVFYVISYLFVFGGYALIVTLNYKFKKWKKQKDSNIEKSSVEDEEVWIDVNIQDVFSADEGIQIFEAFCVKEFSTENLYLYLDVLAKKDVVKGENMKELPQFMSFVFNNYIKNGAPAEVNIPSISRNSFLYLFRGVLQIRETFTSTIQETLSLDYQALGKELKLDKSNDIQVTKQSVSECFGLLERNLLINIGDTFSRFIHTPEFRIYKKTKDLQNMLVERANIVYGI